MNSLQFSHSPPDGRRTISLSLQDLRTDGENINTSNRQQTVTSSKDLMDSYSSLNESLTEISQQESYYRENFYLLLQKSHGTKYEHALRRLYESDLENDSNLATYVQEQSHAQTTQSNDSVALSRSRSFAEQSRIDSNLAKPLERRIWKGSPSKHAVTTNGRGRQRPPPKNDCKLDLAEDWNTSRVQHKVSTKDFKKWLAFNNNWKAYQKEKIKALEKAADAKIQAELTTPKLNTRSVKLADIARRKYESSFEENSVDSSATTSVHGAEEEHVQLAEKRRGRSRSMTPRRSVSSSPRGRDQVFDRLYRDYHRYDHKQLKWVAPDLPFSFSPQICKKSKELIAKRKEYVSMAMGSRFSSPVSRTRSLSPAARQEHAEKLHRDRMQASKYTTGHSRGGKVYPTPSRDQSPTRVQDLLSETRSRSRQRAEQINMERTATSSALIQTLPSGEK